ncbi:MAG: hypothetical protein A2Y38_16170 [Spirochaetes bacterium GWB1_59_5]|nr:MAG: hypothetical protein A2Y38_16170 [Spirochaetes bacterium GWB1_59_5]
MAQLLIKAVDATNPDPDTDRRGCYKSGMIVEVREDTSPRGTLEKWPAFAWITVPGIPADTVRKYMQPELSALTGEVTRRRRWQIRWSELPVGVRNKFQATGQITIKAGGYLGAYDYTWAQVRGYFRDLQTGIDEANDL